jgi:hypothetical protein
VSTQAIKHTLEYWDRLLMPTPTREETVDHLFSSVFSVKNVGLILVYHESNMETSWAIPPSPLSLCYNSFERFSSLNKPSIAALPD